MLPGSELQQIKDINDKIIKTTQLINFSLNTEKPKKPKSPQKDQIKRKKRKELIIESSDSNSSCSSDSDSEEESKDSSALNSRHKRAQKKILKPQENLKSPFLEVPSQQSSGVKNQSLLIKETQQLPLPQKKPQNFYTLKFKSKYKILRKTAKSHNVYEIKVSQSEFKMGR